VKHYEAKVKYIQTNLDTLQETIQKKQENMSHLVNIMQSKLQTPGAAAAAAGDVSSSSSRSTKG
jgi:prefoldin alpha subunit